MASVSNKVLIFGIDSFTGRHLHRLLSQVGLVVLGTTFNKFHPEYMHCDITDVRNIFDILKKINPNYIINLSGLSYVGENEYERFYDVNAFAVNEMLNCIKETCSNDLKKVLLISSATVYGNSSSPVISEECLPKPENHYGISKALMENLARLHFSHLPILIARPFNYVGIGQSDKFLVPKIVNHFKRGSQSIELGNLEIFREFNDVNFVCKIYLKLILSNLKSDCINVCSGRKVSLKTIIDELNELTNRTTIVRSVPSLQRKDDIVSLVGDNSKLIQAVGQIEHISLREILRNIYFNHEQ